MKSATEVFRQTGVCEPEASAEFLATASFNNVETRCAARIDARPLQSGEELRRFVTLCERRRATDEPIQYLVGEWDFHHINLVVRPPVLIPRPETEHLVDIALSRYANRTESLHLLDVGCGSGAIVLALLHANPRWTATAIDVSQNAIDLTSLNASRLGISQSRLSLRQCTMRDLPSPSNSSANHHDSFDLIISNPPYINDADMQSLPAQVREHEDHAALSGGPDGMQIVREILAEAPRLARTNADLWLEVDSSHPQRLQFMKFSMLSFEERLKDCYNNDRYIHFKVS